MAEEVKRLTGEDITTPEMLAAEINKAFAKYNNLLSLTATSQQVKDIQASLIVENKELLNSIKSSGDEMDKMKKELEKFTDTVKVQGETITMLKTYSSGAENRETFQQNIMKQLEKGVFKDIADGRTSKAKMSIETKDVAFGATVGSYGSGDAQHAFMPFQVPQMPPLEQADVRLVVPFGTINSDKLDYPQERAGSLTDAMATATENGNSTESSFGFTMSTVVAHRFTAFVEISRAALKNTGWLANYISNRLMAQFVKALNTNIIAGTGSGSTVTGLVSSANTFLAGASSFAGTIEGANYMDVLNCAAGEMEEKYFLSPNTVLLNPVNARVLASTKNTIADFINPATFLQRDSMGYTTIFGMKPEKFADITKDTYLVAALNAAYMQLLFNGPVEIMASDSHASNFIADLITLKLEASAMLPIYNANALMKGTLSTDLTAITKL
jgi:HK97 family phage major capsid protein